MRVTRTLSTGLAIGVIGAGTLFTQTAFAAELPALAVSPSPTSTSSEFTVSGTGCSYVDGDGVEVGGAVTVQVTYPDGTTAILDSATPAEADGTWAFVYAPTGDTGSVPSGTYSLNATCDVYTEVHTYPAKQFNALDVLASPAVSADDMTLTPGSSTTVRVVGFQADTEVTLTVPDANGNPIVLASGVADLNGELVAAITIPANMPLGDYTLSATASDGTVASTTISVVSAEQTVVHASSPELAATGHDAGGLGLLATGLVLSGGAVLFAGRRKNS